MEINRGYEGGIKDDSYYAELDLDDPNFWQFPKDISKCGGQLGAQRELAKKIDKARTYLKEDKVSKRKVKEMLDEIKMACLMYIDEIDYDSWASSNCK